MARTILKRYKILRKHLESVRFELKASQEYLKITLKKRKKDRAELHKAHNVHYREQNDYSHNYMESITFVVIHDNALIKETIQKCHYYKAKEKEIKNKLSLLLK